MSKWRDGEATDKVSKPMVDKSPYNWALEWNNVSAPKSVQEGGVFYLIVSAQNTANFVEVSTISACLRRLTTFDSSSVKGILRCCRVNGKCQVMQVLS